MAEFRSRFHSLGVVCVSFFVLFLTCGCAQNQPTRTAEPLVRHSSVHGGQQPISGAMLQLYAVGTTGDGSAATPLLTQTVTSDANGNFDLTGDYACPSASSLVYVVATGGNPGLTPGTNNTSITLMAALGLCGNLTPSTFITINELTTVAAIWPLAPFMNSYGSIGSGTSDASALASAFTLASQYVNTATGSAPGQSVPVGTTVPVEQLDTLANILSSCVNSAGGVAGDGSTCGTLFAASTPTGGSAPTNVSSAGLNIVNNPTANVSTLYSLVTGTAPFQPMLPTAPADWTVQLASSSATSALTITPSAQSFPNTTVGVPASPFTVSITNIGTAPAALYGFSIVGTTSADFTQNTTCPANLTPSSTCSVEVEFTPLAIGERTAYLSIISNAPNSPQMVTLSGSGIAGSAGPVTITPSTLNFYQPGDISIVTLSNLGATPLSIGKIALSSSNWTQANNCGSVLDEQSVCTIAVTAGSSTGSFTGTLSIIDNDTTDAQTVQLTSDIHPGSGISFGTGIVGQLSAYTFSIEGGVFDGTLQGYEFGIYGGTFTGSNYGDFLASPNPCQTKTYIGSGGPGPAPQCSINLEFYPSAPGPRSAYFTDSYNNVLPEQGFGLGATKSFVFSPLALNFGNVVKGSSATLNLTVDNSSVVAISFSGPTLSSGALSNGFQIVSSGCSTLPGGSANTSSPPNCAIQVRFAPAAVASYSTMLTLTDSTGITQQALISGQGTYPAPLISPLQLQFGNVQTANTSSPQAVTVVLPNQDAAVANIATANSPFKLSQNTTCVRGASPCQFTVVFNPSMTGQASDSLLVTDMVTGYFSSIPLSGTGGIPVVSLSTTTLTYSPLTVGMTSISQTVTLTNTGNAALSISSVGVGGTNATDFSIVASTCGNSLAASANCSVSVSFTPAATGARNANLVIYSNAASSPDIVQLSGTGN